jgi:hypothetical protein
MTQVRRRFLDIPDINGFKKISTRTQVVDTIRPNQEDTISRLLATKGARFEPGKLAITAPRRKFIYIVGDLVLWHTTTARDIGVVD